MSETEIVSSQSGCVTGWLLSEGRVCVPGAPPSFLSSGWRFGTYLEKRRQPVGTRSTEHKLYWYGGTGVRSRQGAAKPRTWLIRPRMSTVGRCRRQNFVPPVGVFGRSRGACGYPELTTDKCLLPRQGCMPCTIIDGGRFVVRRVLHVKYSSIPTQSTSYGEEGVSWCSSR